MFQFSWITAVLLVVAVLLAVALLTLFQSPGRKTPLIEVSYSQLLKMGPKLERAVIRGDTLEGRDKEGLRFTTELPHDPAIATRLADAGTDVSIGPPQDDRGLVGLVGPSVLWLVVTFILFGIPLFRIAAAVETLARRAGS